MSSKTMYRSSAAALVISGALLALGMILHPARLHSATISTPRWAVSHLFWWLGALAGIVGIAGLYLRHRRQTGVLGFVGGTLSVIGLFLIAGAMYFEAFIAPSVAARAPDLFQRYPAGGGWEGFLAAVLASGALFGLGFLLLALDLLRAGVMTRWAILLAVAGGVPFAVNFLLPRPLAILAVTVFGLGLLGLSYGLWKSVRRLAPGG